MSEKFWDEKATEPRRVGSAMAKGALRCCPKCGKGRLFAAYVKIAPHCPACGVDFSHYRADDGPAYFTIFLVGHIVLPLMLWLEQAQMPALWVHMALWMPLTLILSLGLLPPIKGAVVGLLWALDIKNDDQK